MSDDSEYVAVEYVARMLGVSRRTVCRWTDSGELPSFKFGPNRASAVRIRRSDLDAFLENARRGDTEPEPEPVATPRRRPRRTGKAMAA